MALTVAQIDTKCGVKRRPDGRFAGPTRQRLRTAATRSFHRGGLREEDVARQLGISRRTLARWKRHPVFQAEAARRLERFQTELQARWLADYHARMDALAALPSKRRRRK